MLHSLLKSLNKMTTSLPLLALITLISSGEIIANEPTMELNNKCSYQAGKRILTCTALDSLNENLGDFIVEGTQMIQLRDIRNATLYPNLYSSSNFKNIKAFQLSHSGTIRVHPGTFEGLNNVRYMRFNGNEWNEISNNTFIGLQSLEVLDLDANKIELINAHSFDHLGELRDLVLSRNKLHRISSFVFKGLNKLESLYLNSNEIKIVENDAFVGLGRLDMMFLTGNSLETVEAEEFNKVKEMQHLHLNLNGIERIVGSFDLPNLKFLQLNKNELDGLDEGVFAKCTELISIDLSRNSLRNLTEKPFLMLGKLSLLNLRDSLVDINGFKTLKKTVHIVH